MSISARLFVEDQEYNILEFDLKFNQEVDFMGNPNSNFKGGYWDIKLETIKSPLLLQWMIDSSSMKKVKIVIPSRTGTSKSRNVELLDTYCISNSKAFDSTNTEPLTTSITLSPASMVENGQVIFSKSWRVTDPTPKEPTPIKETDTEKKLIISFDAKKTDIKEGKFGFDKIPDNYKKTCTSNTAIFEKEYNPIQVYGEQYFPVWVSMRKDQKITLELDILKQKNQDLYQTIEFENHPDFTFSPTNLKDAKEVTITCNKTSSNTLQLKLLGDNDPIGAINFFYPAPKEQKVRWIVVDFNKGDKDVVLNSHIKNAAELNDYFKRAFNPALIDIKLVNQAPNILDINSATTTPAEKVVIERIKKNLIEGSKDSLKQPASNRASFLTLITGLFHSRQNTAIQDEITLFLTNLKCQWENANSNDESVFSNNGITIGTTSLMFLKNENKETKTEIPHEIMHALNLEHTFAETGKIKKHTFGISKTKNYMDYNNTKESLFYYQWASLH
ncbi:hypothetical protein NAT51_12865 [Flavobacterium amniphilum]|uniref:type VI secretion system tube protein TssD n=1 Tax=Flavobacterium amniphilum TaxID=1834035 RepID=UPI00202A1765|nr:type VI secretion system tube protein TssD [Flavobacterium amniphilum]MCL9805834.1 hypothetical protein [Flavobacterium amniphilum]MCL9806421.1 hypothetical protein [Flavobacterium amniphilum]